MAAAVVVAAAAAAAGFFSPTSGSFAAPPAGRGVRSVASQAWQIRLLPTAKSPASSPDLGPALAATQKCLVAGPQPIYLLLQDAVCALASPYDVHAQDTVPSRHAGQWSLVTAAWAGHPFSSPSQQSGRAPLPLPSPRAVPAGWTCTHPLGWVVRSLSRGSGPLAEGPDADMALALLQPCCARCHHLPRHRRWPPVIGSVPRSWIHPAPPPHGRSLGSSVPRSFSSRLGSDEISSIPPFSLVLSAHCLCEARRSRYLSSRP